MVGNGVKIEIRKLRAFDRQCIYSLIADPGNQFVHRNTSSRILSYLDKPIDPIRAVLCKKFCTELRETVVAARTAAFAWQASLNSTHR
jgi:hypothetical protein